MFDEGIRLLCGFYSAESLMEDLVRIQVKRCLYKQTHVCVAIPRPFVSLRLYLGEGVQKVFYFLCLGIKKHHLNVFTR